MPFIIQIPLSPIPGCYLFIIAYHLSILITFILLVLILTHCHYLPLASIITLYFLAFDLALSILTSLFPFILWIFSLLCQPSHGHFMLIPHSMGHLSHPSLGSHSSFPHHYVALYLTLPIFTWLFYVNTSWHGASFAPQLRQPLIFSHHYVALCLTLPIFTWLFYGMGIFCILGSHFSFPHYCVFPCLPLPHQAFFALQPTLLCEPFLLLIDY